MEGRLWTEFFQTWLNNAYHSLACVDASLNDLDLECHTGINQQLLRQWSCKALPWFWWSLNVIGFVRRHLSILFDKYSEEQTLLYWFYHIHLHASMHTCTHTLALTFFWTFIHHFHSGSEQIMKKMKISRSHLYTKAKTSAPVFAPIL